MRIRDPIHGTIPIEDREIPLLDSPLYQRLRHIKQLGFGEMAFPGATHTRHAHSLGAMHVASRLFDAAVAETALPGPLRDAMRRIVRVATMLHDIGHMPVSHASERIAPPRASLGLPSWVASSEGRASHEDFTVQLMLASGLTPRIAQALEGTGYTPEAVASLVSGHQPPGGNPFFHAGRDFTPLLRQMVSGELDADRMDYLLRDSFYTGVNYGRYDMDWMVQNLRSVEVGDRVYLGIAKAAVFAFEDFLLSRYHMFVSVYYHHTATCFDELLRRYYEEVPGEFQIPSDPAEFLGCDDVALWHALRTSKNRWAQRLVSRRGFKLLAQITPRDKGYDLEATLSALQAAGIESFRLESMGILSKYFHGESLELYVIDPLMGRLTPMDQYTPLYERYGEALRLERIYCDDGRLGEAQQILKKING
jgi:HD superfamily phosphohydrolase